MELTDRSFENTCGYFKEIIKFTSNLPESNTDFASALFRLFTRKERGMIFKEKQTRGTRSRPAAVTDCLDHAHRQSDDSIEFKTSNINKP